MGKCKVFMLSLCRQTDGWVDRQTDRQTDNSKTICPNLSMWKHKNNILDETKLNAFEYYK